jgi:hypothetical protein
MPERHRATVTLVVACQVLIWGSDRHWQPMFGKQFREQIGQARGHRPILYTAFILSTIDPTSSELTGRGTRFRT